MRALLIQKDVKQKIRRTWKRLRLRALLIQKDVKHVFGFGIDFDSLRALLIQKDVKLYLFSHFLHIV